MKITNKTIIILLLSLITILYFNNADRYIDVGAEMLKNNKFKEPLLEWSFSGDSISIKNDGVLRLDSTNKKTIVQATQSLVDINDFSLIRVSCSAKTKNIKAGSEQWMTARVALFSYTNENQPMYYLPHILFSISGNNDWKNYEGIFLKQENVAKQKLAIQLVHATGIMWIKNLSIRPVKEKEYYTIIRYILILAWCITGAWIAISLLHISCERKYHTLILIVGLVILLGALSPGQLKKFLMYDLFSSNEITLKNIWHVKSFNFDLYMPGINILKAGHFILFGLLAMISTMRNVYNISNIAIILRLLIFAFATEVLQLFINGRNAQLADVFVDGLGIIIGVMFGHTFYLYWNRE